MELTKINPKQLKPYDKNPRINDKAVEAVKNSIEKFGFNQPLVCNQKNIICVGHTRWKAALELGLEEIPVYKKKMSEKEFIAYNIADNRTAENSKWDEDILSLLVHELEELDPELISYTGLSEKELEAMLDDDSLDDLVKETEVSGHTRTIGGEKSHVKMIQIFLNDITFPQFIEWCETLQKHYETSNLTDTIFKAIKEKYSEL